MAEYIKIKDKYFKQLNEIGFSKKDKLNYKKFTKEYEDYKNLYNIKNHQNISEIRDVIKKYGENANIHLGGIPMIADDMMSYIKSDIVIFGIGICIYHHHSLVSLQKYKVGYYAFIRLFDFSNYNDWVARFFRMESNSDFIKLHCFNAHLEYGNEHTCYS